LERVVSCDALSDGRSIIGRGVDGLDIRDLWDYLDRNRTCGLDSETT
jgi:hypothetical protein